MSQRQKKATVLPIGDYDWIVLKRIGNSYFVLALGSLFKGYYSLTPCPPTESKLYQFLNTKLLEQMSESGVDTSQIRNLGILSAGQYAMYVKGRIPNSDIPFMLHTPFEGKDNCVSAVDKTGEIIPVGVMASCAVRPCLFIDCDYVEKLTGLTDITALADISTETVTEPIEETVTEPIEETIEEPVAETIEEPTVEETVEEPVVETIVPEEPEEPEEVTEELTETLQEVEKTLQELEPEEVEIIAEPAMMEMENGESVMVKDEGHGVHSIYLYEDDYRDYAILLRDDDERVAAAMEKHGLAIRAFLASSANESRCPLNPQEAVKQIESVQSRWSWQKKA